MIKSNETLKAKVLVGYGFLLSFLGALYAPAFVKAVVPFALCIVLAAALMHAPSLMALIRGALKRRARTTSQQATRVGTATAVWCDHIDYDNFHMPTYLRHGEEC